MVGNYNRLFSILNARTCRASIDLMLLTNFSAVHLSSGQALLRRPRNEFNRRQMTNCLNIRGAQCGTQFFPVVSRDVETPNAGVDHPLDPRAQSVIIDVVSLEIVNQN